MALLHIVSALIVQAITLMVYAMALIVRAITMSSGAGAIFTPLTIFGLFAVIAMVVCYTYEDRGPGFILAFAGACVLGSIYGFLQGAWPFGAVELVWSAIAISRWRKARRS